MLPAYNETWSHFKGFAYMSMRWFDIPVALWCVDSVEQNRLYLNILLANVLFNNVNDFHVCHHYT